MNKKRSKQLKALADSLPVVMRKQLQTVKGSVLIEQGVFVNEADEKIIPENNYLAEQPTQLNAYSVLKDIYVKKGMTEVENYCQYIREVGDGGTLDSVQSEWFDEDNVHMVGGGKVHYTDDESNLPIPHQALQKELERYLKMDSGNLVHDGQIIDNNVRLYIFKMV